MNIIFSLIICKITESKFFSNRYCVRATCIPVENLINSAPFLISFLHAVAEQFAGKHVE